MNCKHSLFCEHCAELRNKLDNLIMDYRYKSVDLGRDLKNMTERESTIRDALDKVVDDLEELLK